MPGGKYYVRAIFGYGNYDRLNSPPTFDLYVGVNYWTTVRIVNGSIPSLCCRPMAPTTCKFAW
jgi:hypothetical protein